MLRVYISTVLSLLSTIGIVNAATFPDLYLRGSEIGSNWEVKEDFKFSTDGEGNYSLSLPSLSGEFKISNKDWTVNLGAADPNTATVTQPCNVLSAHAAPNYKSNDLKDVVIHFHLKMDGNKPAKTYVQFDIDGVKAPEIIDIDGSKPSGTLPVIYVNTDNNEPIVSKEEYLKGHYYLDAMGVDGIESIGSKENPLPLQIKGRGNFTWISFDKKPYRLKLDKKASLLGMNNSKHFALLAHADDNRAFMRNLTGFEVSRMAGMAWTPEDQPCELVLNGEYQGLYFLTETIRFDKKRINLTDPDDVVDDWLKENPDKTARDYPWTDEEYTGPWLIEFDNNPDEYQIVVPSYQNKNAQIRVTYKTPEDNVTEAHLNWLSKEIAEIDYRLYKSGTSSSWMDKIDLTDAARFFVINQIMNNYESYSGSCYLTKNKGFDEKWHFGPVWDFGSSFQVSRDQSLWIFESQYSQHWAKALWDKPEFQTEVKRIFETMNEEGFERITRYQDNYAKRIEIAAQNDAMRWKKKGYGNPDITGPKTEVQQQLKNSINSFGAKLGVAGYEYVEPELDLYVRGEATGWQCKKEYKFTHVDNNIYELTLRELSGEFKIGDEVWNKDYGMTPSQELEVNKTYNLTVAGSNMKFLNDPVYNIFLRLDVNANTLTISNSTDINEIVSEGFEDIVYFNLQGIKVDNPVNGQIYICVKDGRSSKIIY